MGRPAAGGDPPGGDPPASWLGLGLGQPQPQPYHSQPYHRHEPSPNPNPKQVICPASGAVQRFIDLSGLMSAAERRRLEDPREHVLNGIAHDEEGDRLFVTGKCWPNIFQVSM